MPNAEKPVQFTVLRFTKFTEKETKGGPKLSLLSEDEQWYSLFDGKLFDAARQLVENGHATKVGWTQSGDFKNVKSLELVESAPTPTRENGATATSNQGPTSASAREANILYQVGVKAAAEVMAALVAAGGDKDAFPALIESVARGATRLADGADGGREPTVGAIMKARALLAEGSAIAFGDVAADFSAWLDINFQVKVINGLTARQVVVAAAAISRLVDDQEQAGAA